jgi:transcriptional regulator with GAF, ATPase, and Fis domain
MVEPDGEMPTGLLSPLSREGRHAFRLAVVGGPSSGAQRLIDSRELRIGKASANHLCIPDPTVSRFHCVIEQTPRGLLLRDLGSTNGTQVGGCWVDRVYVAPGVSIKIGSTLLQVLSAEAAAPAPVVETVAARLLGSSKAIEKLLASLPKVASSGVTVLIEGETGTGKSVIAELIHQVGPRPQSPFVVVDCGSIPPSLIESELFGHERGSFTGATERRIGAFEAAHGGTIFLDEIGELPLPMQPKLLRALEARTIKRIGSTKEINIDVQVIAATNRDLRGAVARGDFRADLYYRLDALRLHVPPLRERREDVPLLIEQFARKVKRDVDAGLLDFLKRTLAAREEWPGNVRELRNAVEKAVLFGDLGSEPTAPVNMPTPAGGMPTPSGGLMPTSPLPRFDGSLSFRLAKDEAIAAWERRFLVSLIEFAKGNLSQAARAAQMDRSHLRELLRRYQIVAPTISDHNSVTPTR